MTTIYIFFIFHTDLDLYHIGILERL